MNDNPPTPDQTGSSITGESDEVLNHVLALHRKAHGPTEIIEMHCPCGRSIITLCVFCNQPIWAGKRGAEWCDCIRRMDAKVRQATGSSPLRLL